MGLGALLRRESPEPALQARAAGDLTLAEWLADTGTPTFAGVPVTASTAMRLPAVAAAVALLADTLSALPVDVQDRDGVEIDPPRLFVEPAAGLSMGEWVGTAARSLLLHGDVFGLVVARTGRWLTPAQVELVDPGTVGVHRDDRGALVYRVAGREVPRADMWHVRGPCEPGALRGTSPVELAREVIALGLALTKYGAEFFSTGGVPTVVLKSLDPHLDAVGAQALKDAVIRSQRSRSPLVVNAATDVEVIAPEPGESGLVELAGWVVAEVARAFGLPPELLGAATGDAMTYSNVQSRELAFLKHGLQPWITRLENGLARLLPAGQRARFNVDALLRSTTSERYAAHEVALRAGFLTVAEVRALEDMPPLPGGTAAA